LPALSYFHCEQAFTIIEECAIMIKRITHVGVAVRNMGISRELFSKLLGNNSPHTEKVEEQKATIAFYPIGESSIELIESTESAKGGSSIAKFIEKRGEGIHHICLEVDNIAQEIMRLKSLGFQFVDDKPSPGGDGCLVAFLHPKSTNGVLIELSQKIESQNEGKV
jgi:methylmalonyl-CoA/ethylmalonyl-CoA epimerase